ncbi:pre-mRNA splicing factor [Aspergillus californicus]
MDFAALMSKEIGKAKGPSPGSEQTGSSKPPEKKYLRRADEEAARVTAYKEEQARLAKEREERIANKRKLEDDEAERRRERDEKKRRLAEESRKKRDEQESALERERRKRIGLPELPPTDEKDETPESEKEAGEDISEEDLTEKLRGLDEPIKLFGETHRSRLRRYKKLLERSLEVEKFNDGPIPTTLEPVPEVEMKIPSTVPKDAESRQFLLRQLASYFNMVLLEWELALAKRDVSVKQSLQGRQAYNAMLQSRENMTPLIRKFERSEIDDTVLGHIVEIIHKAQLRRYVDANDAYLRLSIGKAAWPIGVTMVGIHERSAREKLHQGDRQAHILSDEITRKYLQSIKRCLSFAQTRWPPDDQLQIMG